MTSMWCLIISYDPRHGPSIHDGGKRRLRVVGERIAPAGSLPMYGSSGKPATGQAGYRQPLKISSLIVPNWLPPMIKPSLSLALPLVTG
ncbi:hypothetical protein CEXT_397901 [Caerostris extrusa]|uniref:Uncharacterized protein n=1 Tax=Caerostris extrusa TaxID=172846 RepID=A0AAV4S3U8_CAEEX|nr:hypothetical protein CEXT_397901 [Caerostris extrusa]